MDGHFDILTLLWFRECSRYETLYDLQPPAPLDKKKTVAASGNPKSREPEVSNKRLVDFMRGGFHFLQFAVLGVYLLLYVQLFCRGSR